MPIADAASPARTCRDSIGSSAVPTAVPITPSGNCCTRSAKYSTDTVPGRQQAGDNHIDGQIELRNARADQPGRHAPHQQSHLRRHPRPRNHAVPFRPPNRHHQQTKLRDTGNRHTPRQRMTDRRHIGRHPDHAGDRDDIEQHIGRRCRGEFLQAVQHAGNQSGQADQDQVGKGDPRQATARANSPDPRRNPAPAPA